MTWCTVSWMRRLVKASSACCGVHCPRVSPSFQAVMPSDLASSVTVPRTVLTPSCAEAGRARDSRMERARSATGLHTTSGRLPGAPLPAKRLPTMLPEADGCSSASPSRMGTHLARRPFASSSTISSHSSSTLSSVCPCRATSSSYRSHAPRSPPAPCRCMQQRRGIFADKLKKPLLGGWLTPTTRRTAMARWLGVVPGQCASWRGLSGRRLAWPRASCRAQPQSRAGSWTLSPGAPCPERPEDHQPRAHCG
eukprot:1911841-Rhodomonas_salina.3